MNQSTTADGDESGFAGNPYSIDDSRSSLSGGKVAAKIPTDALTVNGYPKTVAAVVSALSAEAPLTLRQISRRTNLSNTQISSGLRQCRFHGWVTSSQGKGAGRGRPAHLWKLTLHPIELIRGIDSEVRREHTLLSDAMTNLSRVRERAEAEGEYWIDDNQREN